MTAPLVMTFSAFPIGWISENLNMPMEHIWISERGRRVRISFTTELTKNGPPEIYNHGCIFREAPDLRIYYRGNIF
jgi:hypothetical protein